MVHNHHVIHEIHLLPTIEHRPMGNIVLRFANFDESLIDESNTTLELENLCIKRHPLLEN
jgi:hypothetical protein